MLYKYSRLVMMDNIPDGFEEKEHEVYLGYGKYAMCKAYNIKYSKELQCFLVEYRWNPKETYIKLDK